MRIPILLFLTFFSLFVSCNKSKKNIRKFDLDSQSFLFFNEGSYWIYEHSDNYRDTVTLVEVETGYKDDKNGDDYVEYRIDKYWSSANQHYFTRTSEDTSIYIYSSQFKRFEYRDIFKFTNKYHTYYSDVEKPDEFADPYFFIGETNANIVVNGVNHYGKSILTQANVISVPDSILDLSGNFVSYDSIFVDDQFIKLDSHLIAPTYGARTTYIDGIGMVEHDDIANAWDIKLIGYYLAP